MLLNKITRGGGDMALKKCLDYQVKTQQYSGASIRNIIIVVVCIYFFPSLNSSCLILKCFINLLQNGHRHTKCASQYCLVIFTSDQIQAVSRL